jgi:lipoprotein-releasing system permease protein
MPKNFTFLLASRYIRGIHGSIATMVRVCCIAIVVSSFALALTMAIMRGFEVAMEEKLQGIHAQIILRAYGNGINTTQIEKLFTTQFPEIVGWAPQDTRHVMLQKLGSDDLGNVMMLKAIDPAKEQNVSIIARKITTSSQHLTTLLTRGNFIIGKKLAQEVELSVGQSVHILFPPEESHGNKVTFDQTTLKIAGFFETGVEEYDLGVLYCSFDTFQELFPNAQATQLGIRLKPGTNLQTTLERLRKELASLEVYSWKDLYPALISATTLERYIMFLILSLMTLVAALNIVALLFMQITYKRSDIAILYAMGASATKISHIFLAMGMMIAFLCSTLGLLLAYIACLVLQKYPFISLPDVYYTSHLPAVVEPHLFALVFLVTMALSFLATWYPVQRTKKMNIAAILRHEG